MPNVWKYLVPSAARCSSSDDDCTRPGSMSIATLGVILLPLSLCLCLSPNPRSIVYLVTDFCSSKQCLLCSLSVEWSLSHIRYCWLHLKALCHDCPNISCRHLAIIDQRIFWVVWGLHFSFGREQSTFLYQRC